MYLKVAVAILSLAMTAWPAAAEKRVALVVGNSNYRALGTLANPSNDAKLLASTLRSVGFTLVGEAAQLDLDKRGLERVVEDFGGELSVGDVAVFFYAGHGVQVQGNNYLVPVDASLADGADVAVQLFDINLVLREMKRVGTRLNILILDACRNNPFGGVGMRPVSSGLAEMRAPEGTLISFSTQPGNVALDGDDGDSPFSKALAVSMRQRGLDLFETFNDVGKTVVRETKGRQQPWISVSPISGTFYFSVKK